MPLIRGKTNIISVPIAQLKALKHKISDDKIEIDGYFVIRNDLRNNERCGGVLLYHKNDLSVNNRPYLQIPNTIIAEISISREKIFVIVSYRKPSQSDQEFTIYCDN